MIMQANEALDGIVVPIKKWQLWLGRVISALPALMLAMSAAMKMSHQAPIVAMLSQKLGYPEAAMTGIGLLELFVVVLYAVPRTAILGAVLMTGYLGGAIASHVRIGEPFVAPLALGILAWLGLYLRNERVRSLSPLRGQ
jgi:hypothetical protein